MPHVSVRGFLRLPILLDDIFDGGTAAVCVMPRVSAHLLLINDNTC